MPKRKRRDEVSDAYILRKIRKLSKKLRRRRRLSSSSSSSSEPSNMNKKTENNNMLHTLDDDDISNKSVSNFEHMEEQEILADITNKDKDEPDGLSVILSGTALVPESVVQPSNSTASENTVTAEPELDQELLDLLGETPCKDKQYGPEIQNDLAVRWNFITTNGLSKEARKEFVENIFTPENCKLLDAPILNDEVKAALSEALIKKDKAIEHKQKQRAAAISCLGEAITKLLSSGNKDAAYIKPLIVAGRLLCDLQHNDSMIRRSFICSTLNKDIKDHLYKTEIDKYLFGEKLSDTLRAAKFINKSGADMKIQTQTKRKPYLNSRTPPSTNRQTEVTRSQEPARGPSRQYPYPPPARAPYPAPPQRPQRQQPRSQAFMNRRR